MSVAGERAEVVWHHGELTRAERWKALGQQGAVVWLTGLSGSGKSTVAAALERLLVESGRVATRLDGDNVRHGLCADLGFSPEDRSENIRRIAEAAALVADAGVVALVPVISPYEADRAGARATAEAAGLRFVEVFVDTPVEECERRDPKGLYARARAGELVGFTGVDAPYEVPTSPDLRLTPEDGTPAEQAAAVAGLLAAAR